MLQPRKVRARLVRMCDTDKRERDPFTDASAPEDIALGVWLRTELHRRFDGALAAPLPDGLARLLAEQPA